MSHDLGHLFRQWVAGEFRDDSNDGSSNLNPADDTNGGGGLPPTNGNGNGNGSCDPFNGMVFNPRANCGQGKWVKRRRRKKRLASASDIKDLTALLSVFGNGKALQTWIATH